MFASLTFSQVFLKFLIHMLPGFFFNSLLFPSVSTSLQKLSIHCFTHILPGLFEISALAPFSWLHLGLIYAPSQPHPSPILGLLAPCGPQLGPTLAEAGHVTLVAPESDMTLGFILASTWPHLGSSQHHLGPLGPILASTWPYLGRSRLSASLTSSHVFFNFCSNPLEFRLASRSFKSFASLTSSHVFFSILPNPLQFRLASTFSFD